MRSRRLLCKTQKLGMSLKAQVDYARFVIPMKSGAKGERGGLRVIYYWWVSGQQFWLFTLFNKNEMGDLTPEQRKILKDLLKHELEARRNK